MGFDEVIDRTSSASSRWQGKGGVLALTTGDADFRTPPAVVAAIKTRAEEGVLGYDTPPPALAQVLCERMEALYGWQIEPETLVFLPGVVPGLNVACRAFVPPGGHIICETPVYYPFLSAPSNADRGMLTVPALLDMNRWALDFDGLTELASRDDVHMLLLCHPQNPLGRVLSKSELQRVSAICSEHDVLVCSDEIHCDLVYDGASHVPLASIDEQSAANTITLMSPSKAFGMSGLGGAFAIIENATLRERFEQGMNGIVSGVNAVAIAAMQAAYTQCSDYLAEELAYLQSNRDTLFEALGSLPGVSLVKPEATYFLWLDFRRSGLNDPFATLLDAGVELSPGDKFGGDGFLRLNFASSRSVLEQAVTRMQSVFG